MQRNTADFVDLLAERRKDCDIAWAIRPMNPLLPHKLPPELRYNREQTIQYILSNGRICATINRVAATLNVSIKDVEKRARAILNEMANKEDLMTVRFLSMFITKTIKRMYTRIYVNECKIFSLKHEMQLSQVQYVYVPTHRSYFDFILMSYILFSYDMALPNIAGGIDFYKMRIIGELLRKTGAFYMRRSFSNDLLYKEIFRCYINTIISHSGRAIEFFIEGTRSRSQKSLAPKYGLLSVILDSLLDSDVPDIQFVPISISYERPPEELLFAYELLGIPKPKETTSGLFRSRSMLDKPLAYGRIFFNICEPISARSYVNMSLRKARVLSPCFKLPSSISETMAHLITDSHKKNTVLMPINIIALLFNEWILTRPREPYTLDLLATDYRWFKNFLVNRMGALVYPEIKTENDDVKQEILMSLRPHEELIVFDASNTLRLKQRHKTSRHPINMNLVQGHFLSEQTMSVAVSAMNLTIYLNSVLDSIMKAALITVTIEERGIPTGEALKRYELLRMLFSTEFVFRPSTSTDMVETEWRECLDILLSENCLRVQGNKISPGENAKLFSILHNVALPFVDVVYTLCTLLERDEIISSVLDDKKIFAEMQKEVEKLILAGDNCCQHPYCLTLDLYRSTLSTLLSQGILERYLFRDMYRVNENRLADLISALRDLHQPLRHPAVRYIDALSSIFLPSVEIQAKL
ncbi:dihydroxyacetone phosphate acyltransferase isoform X2 [Odontomachus brunneus]|uniref:dihydroxyacetone phosphate acyltransferase isoform X2 n=1 Tax=Odontomachus brunneus TaxID=486640 RepID=UPI0013F1F62A|nr:dihydroxyacetone phosphate acyltransferase isoform X2 [Odontomachus brunneus]